ncbi:MAG: Integral rane sensor signal transduction histidine kinase [Pedosphaera sp.]|nr:Integral rane sensor signal transduction histidine kinase [Pedosphaera sp.]
MNTRSIRFQLVVWYAGLLMVVFLLLGGLMHEGLRFYLEQSLSKAQVRRAQQIAETLLANIGKTGEAYVINEINAWFAPETNDRFIRITRGDGSVLYISKSPKDMSFDASQVPLLSVGKGKQSWRKEAAANKQLLIAAVPTQSDDGKMFLVEVGASLQPIEAVLHRLVILLALVLAAMLVVAIGGGSFLIRNALGPVERIARSAEQITLHNLKERLPIAQTGDELERLSISLNHMIARLEDALQHNRRFIADASHELRTPLTIMRGELESMVEGAVAASDLDIKAASILEEVERLTRIVEGLFAVSRLDAGEAQAERVQFDLAKLVTSTADQMCLLAEDKGISISSNAPREVAVEGDRARMKQVVVNLLDNAIKYTPTGGAVRLSVIACGDKAVLEVEDNGIGIPLEARPHIFERFFRVDKARSREMGGAGLGLSIVKSICTAHGGLVDFQSEEGTGSRFKVELPLCRSNNGKSEH